MKPHKPWHGRPPVAAFKARQGQQGAALIMTAGFMLLAVLCLALVVDTGRLYVEKRKLQRVADMAAIEAMARDGACNTGTAATYATQSAARNSFVVGGVNTLATVCGQVSSNAGIRSVSPTPVGGVDNAIQVTVSHRLPASMIAGGLLGNDITLSAMAVATKGVPLASLAIRTTVAAVDSSRGALLNTLMGGLLGGAVNVSVLGWNGLIGTQLNLFDFLDQLKVNLGLTAGGYSEVLAQSITVGQIIDATSTVLGRDSNTTASTLAALSALKVGAIVNPVTVQLGNILKLQTATSYAGADLGVNVFDLMQGSVQLANGSNALVANVPISLPGFAATNISTKVMEAPQLSAIGNPALAKADPLGLNKIYVRSAQVRSLVSVDLPALSGLSAVVTAVSAALSPVTTLLTSSPLSLTNLFTSLICSIAGTCESKETLIKVLPAARMDVNLDVGGGESYVSDYSCNTANKTLTAPSRTSAAALRVGQMGSSAANAKANVFSSAAPPIVSPVPVLQVGYVEVRQTCLLIFVCGSKVYKSNAGVWNEPNRNNAKFTVKLGLGLKVDAPIAGVSQTLTFTNPPEVGEPLDNSDYQLINSSSVVNSLVNTLASTTFQPYYTSDAGVLGALFGVTTTALNGVKTAMENVIVPLLSGLLDPILDLLMDLLGVNLAQTEVAGQLSCSGTDGVRLVR
ncbi:MAG: pilus assembly protein TadG-related protein [Pseudomonadota bacterium]